MPLNAPSLVSQAVILTLVHRLSAIVGETPPNDESFKTSLWWLQRSVAVLRPEDKLITDFIPRVIPNVQHLLNTTKQRLTILPGSPPMIETSRTLSDIQENLRRKVIALPTTTRLKSWLRTMAGGWLNIEAATGVLPERELFQEESAFKYFNLSRTTRLYGFFGCLIIGFVLSLLGAIVLFFQQLGLFGVLFGIGTVVSLFGTGFLIGFLNQLKLMFKPVRVVAAIIFLASIGMIFVSAFVIKSDIICLVFVFIEYLAYIWYTLSYIPYARAAVSKAVGLG
ncbi:hypothetical protein NMY22_g16568 [Coprinellus aureogranulatus]|nr:hypothetical protein NMY22_g16568 [Coprinellus aureogranulatus]